METGLIALDDIADTIICEVSYLSLTEDASANQTSQGLYLFEPSDGTGICHLWWQTIPIFSSSIPVCFASSARLTPSSESPMIVARSRFVARRRLAGARADTHSILRVS